MSEANRGVWGVVPPRGAGGGPWLVADVGGTNARFALVDGPDGDPYRVRSLPTRDHAGLAEAAAAYLGRYAPDVRPSAACLAVAGPVTGGTFRLTNAGWPKGTPEEVRAHLGLPRLEVINDFEALALALPRLRDDDLIPIGRTPERSEPGGVGGRPPTGSTDRPSASGTLAVVGPGTGLGVAGLVPTPSGWVPLPGEGGQVDIPAATDREVEVARLLRAERGSATAELLLSGDGLTRVHRYLAALDGAPAGPLTAQRICERRDDPLCREALHMFCALLGSLAGNVALTLGARGGVYLGGGILPRIADVLRGSAFRARFEAKPPVEDYLRGIPTALIVHPGPALAGATMRIAQGLPDPDSLEPA
ncbi:glucokinase [Actinomadura sp. 6K520]|uniref:glucokinase n=1 Tax=Actinomadura sp. 6K520 TaxID=2530364 RepID=UPI0010445543|nr:glucokinase [Actinomadura sp. 6K520]TDE36904.1 glucokinase [Actinomadura sp. 6K520]